MAFLGMPKGQESVTKADFVAWSERYIHLPGPEKLTGLDLYGARCGLLHNYSVYSDRNRSLTPVMTG
jgi:hypothetical protein